jgi:hypothetical protein
LIEMMKFIVILLYALTFFIACSPGNEKGKTVVPGKLIPRNQAMTDSARLHLMKIIEGGWVRKDYAQSIFSSRSPFLSGEKEGKEVEFRIDLSRIEGDTILNSKGMLNYHEGARFCIVLETIAGNKLRAHVYQGHNWEADSFYLDYQISGSDSTLFLCEGDVHAGTEKRREEYVRAFRTVPDDEPPVNAIDFLINKVLFSGKYSLFDGSMKPIGEVQFEDEGKVTGISDFKKYKINTDFSGHSNPGCDFVEMYNLGDHTDQYAFMSERNKIDLYTMITDQTTGKSRKGVLRYVLKKINEAG